MILFIYSYLYLRVSRFWNGEPTSHKMSVVMMWFLGKKRTNSRNLLDMLKNLGFFYQPLKYNPISGFHSSIIGAKGEKKRKLTQSGCNIDCTNLCCITTGTWEPLPEIRRVVNYTLAVGKVNGFTRTLKKNPITVERRLQMVQSVLPG